MKGFEEIIKAKDEEAVLEGTVSASVKGGVIINYAGVRVFIPASQSGLPRGAEMDSLVKTTQRFVILEVNEDRRRAVLFFLENSSMLAASVRKFISSWVTRHSSSRTRFRSTASLILTGGSSFTAFFIRPISRAMTS